MTLIIYLWICEYNVGLYVYYVSYSSDGSFFLYLNPGSMDIGKFDKHLLDGVQYRFNKILIVNLI